MPSISSTSTTVIATSFAVVLSFSFAAVRLSRIGKREHGLPPGPPTVPLLGNLHVLPTEFAHLKFTEWAKVHGEIYSLKIGPGVVVVLSSARVVKQLMDKRSASTADRPANYISDQITGGLNMVLARYSDNWRTLRKTAHAILTPQATTRHLPIQKAEAIQLMRDLLHTPEEFYTHIRRYSNSVIMSVVYGKRSPRYATPHATAFFRAQHLWERALEPGAHPPLDLLPFLKYIPERWAPWKTLVRDTRKAQRELYFGLLEECEESVRRGEENGCYMEEVLRRQEEFGMQRELVGYLGGVLIEGGSDTTSSFLQSLIISLVAFPDAQRKAHEEIDHVISSQRMPIPDDWDNLPYIQAVVMETHRFRPVAPLAVPHGALADEEYNGYLIPQGSTIFVNAWGIFHDPDVFEDPEVFNPDRYILTEHGTKPGVDDQYFRANLAFGCGRRICPGIHLANNSLMLNSMNLIWAFNFAKAVDPKTGAPIPVDIFDYEKGILTAPRPFRCSITPRSQQHAELIDREFSDAISTFLPFEESLGESEKEWIGRTRT